MKWLYVTVLILALSLVLAGCVFKKNGYHGNNYTGGSYDYTNKKAPKTIDSKDISFFEYSFITHPIREYEGRDLPYMDRCTFSLKRGKNGALCKGSGGEDGFAVFDFEFIAPLAALDDLQVIVDEYKLAGINGEVRGAIAIPEGLGACLDVSYESEENIYAESNTGPILDSKADLALYDFFFALAKEADSGYMYSDEEFQEIISKLWGYFTRFESIDGKKAVVFDGYHISVFENGEPIEDVYAYINADKIYNIYFDESLGPYKYLEWRDGILFGIQKDDSEIEFYSVNESMCPECSHTIEITEELYNKGYIKCPSCQTLLEFFVYKSEEKTRGYTYKELRRAED